MTPHAAETLAVKISQTWPRSAPVDVWVEDLADLDEGAAGTTFIRLRRELQHPPSIAQFRTAVRALDTTDASTRPAPCSRCDDTGWIDAPDRIQHAGTDHERRSTQVQPCNCTEGSRRRASTVWGAHNH